MTDYVGDCYVERGVEWRDRRLLVLMEANGDSLRLEDVESRRVVTADRSEVERCNTWRITRSEWARWEAEWEREPRPGMTLAMFAMERTLQT